MKRYRKKPIVIDAIQFNGTRESGDAIRNVWPEVTFGITEGKYGFTWDGTLQIPTLEGIMKAKAGDWIICGVKGEIYPCKPDIFEATYEEVEP